MPRGELRVHAASRYAAQCHRVFVRLFKRCSDDARGYFYQPAFACGGDSRRLAVDPCPVSANPLIGGSALFFRWDGADMRGATGGS